MSSTVEYGSKAAADDARYRWSQHICPDDDRRLKTVRFVSNVPDDVLREARRQADDRDRQMTLDDDRVECDHARGLCRHGSAAACEFLAETCGFDDDEVDAFLAEAEPDRPDQADAGDGDDDIDGKAAGALRRSWDGYQAGVEQLVDNLEAAAEDWENAQAAAQAINEIRAAHGQDPLHLEKLERAQAALADLARKAGADCHECHADHSQHDHDVTTSPVEDIREFVDGGREATPVGSGGDRGDDPTDTPL